MLRYYLMQRSQPAGRAKFAWKNALQVIARTCQLQGVIDAQRRSGLRSAPSPAVNAVSDV
jgi:hypothetical protein